VSEIFHLFWIWGTCGLAIFYIWAFDLWTRHWFSPGPWYKRRLPLIALSLLCGPFVWSLGVLMLAVGLARYIASESAVKKQAKTELKNE